MVTEGCKGQSVQKRACDLPPATSAPAPGTGRCRSDGARRVEAMYQQFQALISAAYFDRGSSIALFDGALHLLDRLRAAGIKVALNTGYPRAIADGLIASLGLAAHIDGSCVAEEVGAGRPYPYMIHELMRRLRVADVRRVAKVGDTARDMEEGRNAGCGLVVGVTSGADGRDTLRRHGADVVLGSVKEMMKAWPCPPRPNGPAPRL